MIILFFLAGGVKILDVYVNGTIIKRSDKEKVGKLLTRLDKQVEIKKHEPLRISFRDRDSSIL